MAGRAIPYVGKLVSNLIKLLPCDFEDLKCFWGLEEELSELRESLDSLANLVENADEKQERWWLIDLRDVAYLADDVLSELSYEATRLKIQTKEVVSLYPNSQTEKAAYRLTMSHKLKEISKLLRSMQSDGQYLRLRSMQCNFEDMSRFWTHSILENSVAGRDDDVAKIVNLVTSSCNRRLTVVPIVGLGGLGKTVLAKLVSQRVMSRNLFDVKMWVNVPKRYKPSQIYLQLLQSLNGGLTNKEKILQQLEKELAGKRFLLVLDDVREDESGWWNYLKTLLLEFSTNNGNVVLVTTRSEHVASSIETSSQHRHALDVLSDQDCWLVLEKMAFRNVTTPYPSYFGDIGRDIAIRCRGVPLVAKVLGCTLGVYRDKKTWLKIRNTVGHFVDCNQSNELSMLRASFNLLPSYLKPCLAFCSVFPEGFSIRKEELISFWMTEGFAESCDEGEKYFDALLAHSFFQDAEMDDNGQVVQFKIHDLVRDLASSLSEDEPFSIHHLYVDDGPMNTPMPKLEYRGEKVRTIILDCAPSHFYHQSSFEFKRLRSLQFNGTDVEVLGSSISTIKLLRYLNFLNSEIEELPEFMAVLYNLQILDLSNSKFKKLSESFTNLYNLQSLNLSNSKIEELPELITNLYSSQTLNLSNSNINQLPGFITKLQNLQTLNISNSKIKKLPESISNLSKLQILDVSNTNIKELPGSIGKLHNLQTLNASKSKVKKLPESISSLLKLRILDVSSTNIKEVPGSIGKLHNLQTLNVSKTKIKKLPKSITALYNLQTLKFVDCKELIKLPRKRLGNLINLKHIAFSFEHQMPSGMGKLNGLETLPFFVVGPDWGGCIQELECLSKLSGHLEITRLEEVVDKKEADRANLQEKTDLQGLGFQWSYGDNGRSSSDEELLEGLRPNTNMKRIKIKYYMGEKWPSWMLRMASPSNVGASRALDNLVELSFEKCWNCVQLPRLGDLPCLQFLHVSHMKRLKCVGNEFYGTASEGNSRVFGALKSLSLSWMENLTKWSSSSESNRVVVFPCLENLSIQSCPKLTGFPLSDVSAALVNLKIKNCDEFRFVLGKQPFPSLTSLSIEGCSKFTYLRHWLQSDTCFKELNIRTCEWLTFVPENSVKLSYLTSLAMHCCKRLRCLPEEILCKLTQLWNLSIGAFSEELDDFRYLNRIKDLPGLVELEIWGSDFLGREMSSLPNQLQHLTALKSLKIMGFTNMEALPQWLTNLQSLQSLSLDYCRHLGCQSIATLIYRLPNLTHLNVYCCSILETRISKTLLHSVSFRKIKVEYSRVSKARAC